MPYRIARLLERGCHLPRYQIAFRYSGPWKIEIREHLDEQGRRHTRRATATNPANPEESLPPLLDAVVIHMDASCLVITGFERLEDDAFGERLFDYRQTWHAESEK
jgi:hypothetical protein